MENKENINEEFETLEELHHNELDDIVLEKYEKKEKLKRYAIIGGAVIVIFFIVFYIVKVITDSSSAPQDTLVEEQVIQSSASNEVSEEEGFEEVPVIAEESQKNQEPTEEKDELNSVIKEVLSKEKKLAKEEAVATQTKTPPLSKPQPSAKSVTPKPKTKPATIAKSTPKKATTQHKSTKKSAPSKVDSHGSYYVQVGAFLKYDPDKNFLAKIKRSGYNYIIKEFHINGQKIKRVYIGPYSSKSSALKQLRTIKRTIASNAFITRLK